MVRGSTLLAACFAHRWKTIKGNIHAALLRLAGHTRGSYIFGTILKSRSRSAPGRME
ncbi:hypothetical protein EMEDMD4_10063 [Sinorhizobium medicae]|uniref:Uncharacterized protein n=1 Tax=Sinorhizobium medicae TaxID=110321 RepID=A0A508WPZ1_9HYPH|nr:hypothetical protein EMEDMD4_10063 [Sinorhizobium medicae]